MSALRITAAVSLLVLAACATRPTEPAAATAVDTNTRAEMVETIRAAGVATADELDVQPLREGAVEDLRERAAALQAQGQHEQAAAVLDEAIARHGDDPAVLQERAEAAVYIGDFDAAQRFTREAIDAGAQVGPLCRRHWSLIEQVALARAAAALATEQAAFQAEADTARQAREACTVAPPARY
ncbi:tetratricopeptide repeat protein [Cognatilysobacter bugurensis]|uniref:Tetratricopeptide repeat protein n=1 Tax=Cognatilysobacter bugurensis TaxID=543356 RepID=A0A918T464_9GAMM|nr:tetratricopeptide repeat protein [Lysobacter bugurensis]GHA88854.1 hypothetical protein GCM10007067_28430 [Lysobacter bugurensis]